MNKLKVSDVTQKWVDALIPFTSNYSAKKTATELSKLSGISQQTLSRIMNFLSKLNLIDYSHEGKNKLFYLGKDKLSTGSLLVILEEVKAINFNINFPRESLIIKKLLDYCEGIILFGSYASGNFKKDSDLDLVLIGKCDMKKIAEIIKSSPLEIHEQIVSYSEFQKNVKDKTAISKEILNNHILFGDVNRMVNILKW